MPDTLKPQTLSVKTQHGRYGVRILLHEVRELIAFLHVAKTEIWVKGVLIPACNSSSLVFHIMYPAYKLNKQCDNI